MKNIKVKKKKKQSVQEVPVVRYQTDKEHGLSEEQVFERKEHKLSNETKIRTSNSYLQIFAKNIFTVFNLIWFVIAVALMCVGAWGDMLFLFVVIANTAISIFQEIKAKNTVEKLSMVTVPKIKVVRTGITMEVKGDDLLLDDIVILENGNQIPADCIIVDGMVEANESLLTGESNLIKKKIGDTLLAGSFLVSGLCYARVDKVGKNNYIQTIAERTKDFKPQTSNLFKDLNSLIKIIVIILIPLGALTCFKEIIINNAEISKAITGTSGALTGMIPAGMYLLITVGLSVGVIKLSKRKTLVKNLYSIEMLARANVLCLDKTGTITDGTMKVVDVVPLNETNMNSISKTMKIILSNQKTSNATSVALIDHFGKELNTSVKQVIEFSSQRKYSATTLTNGKTYYIGAVGFIGCPITTQQKNIINSYMEKGYRVISLVEDSNPYTEKMAGKKGKLIAFFILEDHIRKDAVETIKWFKNNDVEIKIISGDDALTVSKIAMRVGVKDYDKYISLENMSINEVTQIADKFTVFGRVTPEQKHAIIKTLKNQGKVVAMTGDGVNDTLALKEANCSIAMADGSEVARNVSHLVLMNSNFSALPAVVKEGRQIVNNVQHSSVLYLMKTLFTIMLCVTTLVFRISYPFTPKQLLLVEMFIIGIPSFILTFQPNSSLIKGDFIPQVLKRSIPCALMLFVNMLIVIALNQTTTTLSESEFTSLCTLLLTFTSFINLFWICFPLTLLRKLCLIISAFLIICAISGFGMFFAITDYTMPVVVTLITLILCTILLVVGAYYLKEWFNYRLEMANGGTVPNNITLWKKLKTALKFNGIKLKFKKEDEIEKELKELANENIDDADTLNTITAMEQIVGKENAEIKKKTANKSKKNEEIKVSKQSSKPSVKKISKSTESLNKPTNKSKPKTLNLETDVKSSAKKSQPKTTKSSLNSTSKAKTKSSATKKTAK